MVTFGAGTAGTIARVVTALSFREGADVTKGLTPSLVAAWAEREMGEVFDWAYMPQEFVEKLMPLLARIWEDGHADFEDMPNPYGKPTDYALEGGSREPTERPTIGWLREPT